MLDRQLVRICCVAHGPQCALASRCSVTTWRDGVGEGEGGGPGGGAYYV